MSVSTAVTLDVVRGELSLAAAYAAAAGLSLDVARLPTTLSFLVTFHNRDGDAFYVEFDCKDYPLYPPTIEFASRDGRERGTVRLYPTGMHPMPCVCMRYNRKAYQERGGPHGDWRLVDWRLPTTRGAAIDTLTMMLSDMDAKIRQSTGRLG